MVKLTKDAVYLDIIEDGEIFTVDLMKDEGYTLMDAIDHQVDFDENFTVQDLMEFLNRYIEYINLMYVSSLNGYDFSEFYKETLLDPDPEAVLQYAAFTHECSIKEDNFLEYKVMFGAVGKHPETHNMVEYMIDLCSINMYMHLEMRLNTDYLVRMQEIVDGAITEVAIFSAQKTFTLHEVISAFLYEISYHGLPQMREDAREEIKAQIIKESAKKLKGEEGLDELEIKLIDSIQKEDYELSAELRDKISNLKKQIEQKKRLGI